MIVNKFFERLKFTYILYYTVNEEKQHIFIVHISKVVFSPPLKKILTTIMKEEINQTKLEQI